MRDLGDWMAFTYIGIVVFLGAVCVALILTSWLGGLK